MERSDDKLNLPTSAHTVSKRRAWIADDSPPRKVTKVSHEAVVTDHRGPKSEPVAPVIQDDTFAMVEPFEAERAWQKAGVLHNQVTKVSHEVVAMDHRPKNDSVTQVFQDEAFARQLDATFQREEADYVLAWHEAVAMDHRPQPKIEPDTQLIQDEEFARKLDETFKREAADHEQKAMLDHPSGKAFRLVEGLTKSIYRLLQKHPPPHFIAPVASDDLFVLAENLVSTQERFKSDGKNCEITIGYHFTSEHNMTSIRTDGLLSRRERDQSGITHCGFNGASYGEGIYTCDEPISFRRYGITGLLVARLAGTVLETFDAQNGYTMGNDSIMNKKRNLLVLKESRQCLAAVKFDAAILGSEEGKRLLALIHLSLQKLIENVCTPCQAKTTAATAAVDDTIDISCPEIDSLLETWRKPCYTVSTATPSGTGQATAPQVSSTPNPVASAASAIPAMQFGTRKEKEKFLLLTRFLMKYLETKDAALHVKAKDAIRDCAERNMRKESGFESVTVAMRAKLQVIVNEQYWKRAEVYLNHFLQEKKEEKTKRRESNTKAWFRFIRSNIRLDVLLADLNGSVTGLELYNAGVRKAQQEASGFFLVNNKDEIKSLKDKTSQVMIQVNHGGPKFTKAAFLSLEAQFFRPLLQKTPPMVELFLTIEQTLPSLKTEDC